MSCIYCKYLLRAPILGVTVFYAFFPSCCTYSLMILVIKPFDSERNDPVFFYFFFTLIMRGSGLCDVIPISTHVTSLFEFPDHYLCIQHGYAKHPNLFPEGPHKGGVTCL